MINTSSNEHKNEHKNVIIPKKSELVKIIQNYYPTGHREDSHRGTNCLGKMLSYIKGDKEIRLFVKKSFLRLDLEKFEKEYKIIKEKFRNIVPNQGFVSVGGAVFAFCAPIWIKIDVLLEENKEYLIEVLKEEGKLLKQLKFFIRGYEELLNDGLTLDLYGSENLVISNDNKLYYLDSFLVFHESDSVKQKSVKNLEFLKKMVEKAEKAKKR